MVGLVLQISVCVAGNDGETSRLEEVTVTAQRRAENAQDVPIALSAFTEEDLQTRGITNLEGVLESVPSITFAPYVNSSNTFFLYMRGVGFVDPGQIGSDGAVGIYEDGFYIARPQGLGFDLEDVARVEVLRGPQGTLYGRNTIGGAVNLVSREPSGELSWKQDVEFGSRHELRLLAVVDLPRFADLAVKFVLLKSSIDGFITNPGQPHNFGQRGQDGGRVQLLWLPTNVFRADYFFELSDLNSTPQYVVDTQFAGQTIYDGIPYVAPLLRPDSAYRPLNLPLSTTRVSNQGLTLTWSPTARLTVKSLTGYRELNADAFQNYNESTGLPNYESSNYLHQRQVSEELQLSGSVAVPVSLQYVLGGYFFHESASNFGSAHSLAPFPLPVEQDGVRSDSEALYGQLTWAASRSLELAVGVRYTHDHKSGERSEQVQPSAPVYESTAVSYHEVTPGVTLTYHWTPDFASYGRIQEGYKAGAPNYLAPVGRFSKPYGPEHLTSYELGMKTSWREDRLRINAAVFASKYHDEQKAIQVAPYLPEYDAFNIGRETITGIELDAVAQVRDRLRLSASYAFLDARIDSLPAPADTIFDPTVNPYSPYHVGEDVKGLFAGGGGYAPRNSYDVAAEYTLGSVQGATLTARGDYRWQAQRYGAGSALAGWQFATAPAFAVLNGNLALTMPLSGGASLRASLWGRNLLNSDKPLWVAGSGGSIVPVSPAPAGYTATTLAAWVEPRTWGLSLTLQL